MRSGGRYEHLQWEYPSWASINGPAVNLLKGAVLCSDRVVTVSEARPSRQEAIKAYLCCLGPPIATVLDLLDMCSIESCAVPGLRPVCPHDMHAFK